MLYCYKQQWSSSTRSGKQIQIKFKIFNQQYTKIFIKLYCCTKLNVSAPFRDMFCYLNSIFKKLHDFLFTCIDAYFPPCTLSINLQATQKLCNLLWVSEMITISSSSMLTLSMPAFTPCTTLFVHWWCLWLNHYEQV